MFLQVNKLLLIISSKLDYFLSLSIFQTLKILQSFFRKKKKYWNFMIMQDIIFIKFSVNNRENQINVDIVMFIILCLLFVIDFTN